MIHLFDLSKDSARVAACGDSAERDLRLPEEFGKADPSSRCIACFEHFVQYQRWITHCKICGEHIANGRALAEHESRHVLTRASRRLGPLAFTVSVQSHYDSPHSTARSLALALDELRTHFRGRQFTDPIPVRMEVVKDKRGTVMLGEAFVAEYIIVEK